MLLCSVIPVTKLSLWSRSFVAGRFHCEGKIRTKKKKVFLSLESFFLCEHPLENFILREHPCKLCVQVAISNFVGRVEWETWNHRLKMTGLPQKLPHIPHVTEVTTLPRGMSETPSMAKANFTSPCNEGLGQNTSSYFPKCERCWYGWPVCLCGWTGLLSFPLSF